MPIPFTCPHCGAFSNVGDQFAGKSGPCAKCGMTITVPSPGSKPEFMSAPVVPKSGAGTGATVAIVAIVLSVFCLGGGGILVALLLPAVQAAREAARRMQCSNNMKQIGLALHNYHDTYKSFPSVFIPDADGKPMHSWRVALLPYIESSPLYDQYDFNKPWNSPENQALSRVRMAFYSCPSDPKSQTATTTSYMAVAGAGLGFENGKFLKLPDFTDGTANTILVVEVNGSTVNWLEPTDLTVDEFIARLNAPPTGGHPGGINVLFADGSVRFIAQMTPPAVLKSLVTRSGGEMNTGGY